MPELEAINKLYLELSQFATAKTNRELRLEQALSSLLSAFDLAQDISCHPQLAGPMQNARTILSRHTSEEN
jgi:hypothetical protein